MAINQSKTPLVIGSGKRAITFVPTHIEFQEILDMFGDFSGLVAFLTQVNIHGMWSLIGFEVHGLLYSGIWLGELLIFFITVALFFYRKAQRPYSEDSERFLDKIVLKTPLTVPEDLEVLLDKFHQGDYSYVLSAEPASSPQPQYLQNELYYLDGEDDAYLTVKLFESTGKKSTSTRKVLDKICIPRLQAEQLLKKLK
jgi:hypothetical protein